MTRTYPISKMMMFFIMGAIGLLSNSSSFAQSQNELLDEARQLNVEAVNLYNKGRYADAIPSAQRSLVILETTLGRDHLDVSDTLNILGLLFAKQGGYSDAESFFSRSLAIKEKALGGFSWSWAASTFWLGLFGSSIMTDGAPTQSTSRWSGFAPICPPEPRKGLSWYIPARFHRDREWPTTARTCSA